MIGNNIKRLRTERGMTQKALADKLFVSAQAVSRWENNEVERWQKFSVFPPMKYLDSKLKKSRMKKKIKQKKTIMNPKHTHNLRLQAE